MRVRMLELELAWERRDQQRSSGYVSVAEEGVVGEEVEEEEVDMGEEEGSKNYTGTRDDTLELPEWTNHVEEYAHQKVLKECPCVRHTHVDVDWGWGLGADVSGEGQEHFQWVYASLSLEAWWFEATSEWVTWQPIHDQDHIRHVHVQYSQIQRTGTQPMSSTEPEDTVYFGAPWEAAQTFVLGQGFESVSHDRLQRSINKEWFQRLKKAGISPMRILSKAAKALISADIGQGRYRDRTSANKLAYMSPSTDPTQYSLALLTRRSGVHSAMTSGRPSCSVQGAELVYALLARAQ
ncbi:hypothetical protein BDM02DRAFT_3132466 [Thelephora ganbajun]|uniref:Uncharacterized protein n=1 Tax=Thelephora ganbajun TaxID=370292 RepID=A0ACB6Z1E8_THEGA|nr:hypothetical protein BDM02DRAFT_3132466 [Thelephora ganbajun]